MLLAVAKRIGGQCVMFSVVPILAGLAVLATYGIGRRLHSAVAGLIAAWLVATSPITLSSSLEPLTDVPVMAMWALVFFFVLGTSPSPLWPPACRPACDPDSAEPGTPRRASGRLAPLQARRRRPFRPRAAGSRGGLCRHDTARRRRGRGDQSASLWIGSDLRLRTARGSGRAGTRAAEPPPLYRLVHRDPHGRPAARPDRARAAAATVLATGGRPHNLRAFSPASSSCSGASTAPISSSTRGATSASCSRAGR